MFSSFFSASAPVDPHAPNFHSVNANVPDSDLCGPLEANDLEWTCAGGFATETQTFYAIAEDGRTIMFQAIHSSVGLWYPTIQLNCKVYDSKTGERTWKSVNAANFVTPPPGLDKRSSKSDQFSITYRINPGSEYPESYLLSANVGQDLQVSLEVSRPASAPGWKIGKGEKGGFSYFGPDLEKPEGYVWHKFWPHLKYEGHIIVNGKAQAFSGAGMFVHAIQGMRPNLVASAWNFHHFQSPEHNGVSAIMMEFTTCDTHGKQGAGSGPVKVNVGSVVIGQKLVTVTAETTWPGEERESTVISKTVHLNRILDPETGYKKPSQVSAEWSGPSVLSDAPGTVAAKIGMDVGDIENPRGLMDLVDILAEIPYVLKAAVSYVAGTKPYMYQWINPAKLHITGPDAIAEGLSNGVEVNGQLYTESTFISLIPGAD
ncbi:survival factor 1 [Coprinellus micaceus]|uniref:Survival factor 1 n=1 Tax=Coprinellus micaceus TaxID=71717 RepID=A0A4Y7TKM8_COPMI|nr:survival factor 1 [Coprinellus micaceus]